MNLDRMIDLIIVMVILFAASSVYIKWVLANEPKNKLEDWRKGQHQNSSHYECHKNTADIIRASEIANRRATGIRDNYGKIYVPYNPNKDYDARIYAEWLEQHGESLNIFVVRTT